MDSSVKIRTSLEDIRERLKGIRLLVLDVDGVLTDGMIVYSDDGRETKNFHVRDGHGIKLLKRSGVDVAIITARESKVVAHRAKELGIVLVYQGIREKILAFNDILERTGLKAVETAYMGDDIIDLPVMARAGFCATVADGVEEVKERSDFIAQNPGGRGAVREVVELILKAQGKWQEAVDSYMKAVP